VEKIPTLYQSAKMSWRNVYRYEWESDIILSGGIDSPVVSFLSMKRGCRVVFVHFHSFPLVSKRSIEKSNGDSKSFKQIPI